MKMSHVRTALVATEATGALAASTKAAGIDVDLMDLIDPRITNYLKTLSPGMEATMLETFYFESNKKRQTAIIAHNCLFAQMPIQLQVSEMQIVELLSLFLHAWGTAWTGTPLPSIVSRKNKKPVICPEDDLETAWLAKKLNRFGRSCSQSNVRDRRSLLLKKFPRKLNRMAGHKCNLFLDSTLQDLKDCSRQEYQHIISLLSMVEDGEVYEDQACMAVLYAWCCGSLIGIGDALRFALLSILQPEAAKGFSDILKALGANKTPLGGCLVESVCLGGRGVGLIDLYEDAHRRVDILANPAVDMDPCDLRQAVAAVLAEELGAKRPMIDSLLRHWHTRFKWCVSGSHSKSANPERCWGYLGSLDELGQRMTRRVASEHIGFNPLGDWDGYTGVSVIEKQEAGKSRAIYSCGTLSYMHFARLLKPVEEAWDGVRVLLDPGKGGHCGMYQRIMGLWDERTPVAVMLDYADFNSQHTLTSQKIVIEETAKCVVGLDERDLNLMVSSFDKMDIRLDGRSIGRARGTLMSGHRATSYINSVLNGAYLRLALGPSLYRKIKSLHVGDDVLIFCDNYLTAAEIFRRVEAAGLRLQSHKQSVGKCGFEFLRMAGDRHGAQGYVCRSVASLVSGNWTTEVKMAPLEALHSLVEQCRSLINRSWNPEAWRLVLSSAESQTGIDRRTLSEFMSGKVAIGGGPCYRADGKYVSRVVTSVELGNHDRDDIAWSMLPHNATTAYISYGASELEREAMRMVGYIPWSAAVRSSYGDLAPSMAIGSTLLPRYYLRVGPIQNRWKDRTTMASKAWTRDVKHGLLAHHPIIALLKNALTDEQIGRLLLSIGHNPSIENARVNAFGGREEGVTVDGVLPHSDAAALAQYCIDEAVRADVPIAV